MPSCPIHGEFTIGAPCPGCAVLHKREAPTTDDPLAGATFPVVLGPGETVPDSKFCLDCGMPHGWPGKEGGRCPACVAKILARDRAGADPKGAAGALGVQVGGDHYKLFVIQPEEFITRNGIGFLEGCVIKRMCRHGSKNKREDLEKARHEIDLLIALIYPEP